MEILNMLGRGLPAIGTFIGSISGPLNSIMKGILAMIAIAAVIFAVYVGYRLAKAEDEGKRKEAKNQLLWSIIADVVTVALFVLLETVLGKFSFAEASRKISTGQSSIDAAVNALVSSIVAAFNEVLKLATIGAMLFAIYLGVRLATAEDEGKRKQAKQQLFWTLIAVVGVIVLVTVIDMIIYNTLIPAVK